VRDQPGGAGWWAAHVPPTAPGPGCVDSGKRPASCWPRRDPHPDFIMGHPGDCPRSQAARGHGGRSDALHGSGARGRGPNEYDRGGPPSWVPSGLRPLKRSNRPFYGQSGGTARAGRKCRVFRPGTQLVFGDDFPPAGQPGGATSDFPATCTRTRRPGADANLRLTPRPMEKLVPDPSAPAAVASEAPASPQRHPIARRQPPGCPKARPRPELRAAPVPRFFPGVPAISRTYLYEFAREAGQSSSLERASKPLRPSCAQRLST